MQTHQKFLGGAAIALTMLLGTAPEVSAQTSFRVAVGDAAGSAQHELGKKFVEELEAATDGAYTAELFLNGQLGSEQNTVNDASMGLLDMSLLAINNITPFSPTVGIFTLPYVIQGVDDAEKLINSEIGQELVDNTIRDAGVRIIGWTYTGCRVLTNSKKPVATLDDLQGLVIRVPKNEIMIDSYNAWGINPTPMAWSETFTALQQGVVDGQDNPYLTVHSMKFYEVQKYVTDICYIFSIEPLIVSESVSIRSLDPATQEAMLAAGQAATLSTAPNSCATPSGSIKEDLVAKGMQIDRAGRGRRNGSPRRPRRSGRSSTTRIGGKEKLERRNGPILGRFTWSPHKP